MVRQSRAKLKLVDGKPVMDVELTRLELEKLGRLEGADNVELLKRIKKRVPGINLTPVKESGAEEAGSEQLRRIGTSVKTLLDLSRGEGTRTEKNTGSEVSVNLRDKSMKGENLVYRAAPSKPRAVEMLSLRVERIKKSVEHERGIGRLTDAEMGAQFRVLDEWAGKYERAFDLRRRGFSFQEIEDDLGVSKHSLSGWFTGKFIPLQISRRDPEYKEKFAKNITLPREESEDFAYMLGALSATARHWHKSDYVIFQHTDRKVIERVLGIVKDTLNFDLEAESKGEGPIKEKTLSGKKYFTLAFSSNQLVNHFNFVTRGNEHLPWEHLVSSGEREAFAKGFFDFTGCVSSTKAKTAAGEVKHPRIDVKKKGHGSLIKEMGVLLKDVGILPRLNAESGNLVIYDKNDVERFSEKIGFTSLEPQGKLEGLSSNPYSRRTYTVQEYDAVNNYSQSHGNATVDEISKATSIPKLVVYDWVKREKIPPAVERLRELTAIEAGLPDADTIGFLARRVGVGSWLARHVAEKSMGEKIGADAVKKKCSPLIGRDLQREQLEKEVADFFGVDLTANDRPPQKRRTPAELMDELFRLTERVELNPDDEANSIRLARISALKSRLGITDEELTDYESGFDEDEVED